MLMTVLSSQSRRISYSLVSCPDFSRCVQSCIVILDGAVYSVDIREANYKEIHTVTGRLEFRKFSSHKLYSDSASFLLWVSEAGKFANSTSRRLKVQFRLVVFSDFVFDREFASRTGFLRRDIVRIRPNNEWEHFKNAYWRGTSDTNETETDIFAKVVLAKRIICFPAIEEYFFFPPVQVIWYKVRQVFSVGDQKWFRDEGEESNLSHRLFSLHRL